MAGLVPPSSLEVLRTMLFEGAVVILVPGRELAAVSVRQGVAWNETLLYESHDNHPTRFPTIIWETHIYTQPTLKCVHHKYVSFDLMQYYYLHIHNLCSNFATANWYNLKCVIKVHNLRCVCIIT